jgi:hypothetical protein
LTPDFTTNHSWWLNDALLWDSLVAANCKPLLIQETGLQNDFQIDDTWRRSPDNQAYTLERKCALALATSAGVITGCGTCLHDRRRQSPSAFCVRLHRESGDGASMRELASSPPPIATLSLPEQPSVAIILARDAVFTHEPAAVAAQLKAGACCTISPRSGFPRSRKTSLPRTTQVGDCPRRRC